MELYDKAFKPISGVSISTIAAIVGPINARMGIKTGKKRTHTLAAPPGLVMVEVLCALARHGLPLGKVHQGEAGCVFEATMPSDLWSFRRANRRYHRTRSARQPRSKPRPTSPANSTTGAKMYTLRLDQLFGEIDTKAA